MSHRRGFTLIELIIYVGIFAVAATLLTGVLTTFTRVQLRESATTAVSQEAQFVIQTIQRLVTDASLIELTKDAAVSTLKLRMPVAGNDPTCIQFSNGTVYLMQGNDGINKQTCFATSTPQAKTLTTSKVVVNSLTFKKYENPPSTDTVRIDLTVSYNSTNPQESAISRTLQTAIAKVSAATFDSDIIPSADNQYSVGIGANRWKDGLFSGNVGIGTATPSNKLEVDGGSSAVVARISTTNTGSSAASLIISNSSKTAFNDGLQIIHGGGATKFNDLAATNLMTLDLSNTRVGIRTTSPGSKFEVADSTYNTDTIKTTAAGHSSGIGVEGYSTYWGTAIFQDGTPRLVMDSNGAVLVGTVYVQGTGPAQGMAIEGNVGIRTASPDSPLEIKAPADGWNDGIRLEDDATTNAFQLIHDSMFRIGYNSSQMLTVDTSGNLTTAGNITVGSGSGKINAGTIDPIYNIGGTRYATYVPALSGKIREEVTGTVGLRNRQAVIDFDDVPRESDLWLFWQITDFGPRWDNLVVIPAAGFDGRVWYKKDPLNNRLIFSGDRSGEVSFRLTAPRFDHEKWPIKSDAQTGGFELRDKDESRSLLPW